MESVVANILCASILISSVTGQGNMIHAAGAGRHAAESGIIGRLSQQKGSAGSVSWALKEVVGPSVQRVVYHIGIRREVRAEAKVKELVEVELEGHGRV